MHILCSLFKYIVRYPHFCAHSYSYSARDDNTSRSLSFANAIPPSASQTPHQGGNCSPSCGQCNSPLNGHFYLTSCIEDCTICESCTTEHFKHNKHCPSCQTKLESDTDIISISGLNKLHEHFDERKKRVDEIGPFSSNMVRVPDPQRKNNAFCEAIVYIHLQEGEGKDKLTAMVVAGGGQVTSDITHPHINVFVCAHLISIPDAAKECQQRGGHIVSVDWVINSDWRDICLPPKWFKACEDDEDIREFIADIKTHLRGNAVDVNDILKVCRGRITSNELRRLKEKLTQEGLNKRMTAILRNIKIRVLVRFTLRIQCFHIICAVHSSHLLPNRQFPRGLPSMERVSLPIMKRFSLYCNL